MNAAPLAEVEVEVEVIRCLSDNYAYLVTCSATGATALVDAPEAAPILQALGALGPGRRLTAIWSTHHHHDHVGANLAVLASLAAPVPVLGHASDRGRIPGQTVFLEDGATFALGELAVTALHVPGHTLGALAYLVRTPDPARALALFTGDTLFLGGCGRLFEGTPAMMHASLSRLGALPVATLVYCGHEYTAANLRFAAHLEPENAAIAERQHRVATLRAANLPTVPGTLADELATNPFLRTGEASLRASLAPDLDAVGVFAATRKLKDTFRG